MDTRLDRKITVFRIAKSTAGVKKKVDVYTDILASFRQLSDQERVATHENATESTCQFTINRRKITLDEYVKYTRAEYGTTYYQIVSVDDFDEHSLRMKIRCREVEHDLGIEG